MDGKVQILTGVFLLLEDIEEAVPLQSPGTCVGHQRLCSWHPLTTTS